MNEDDDRPRVYQPRTRQPLTHLYGEDAEETVEESKNTLGLFDFFLEMDEAGAQIGDTSSDSSSSDEESDTGIAELPVMRRVLAYGEEGAPSVEVVYSFEVQDSESSSSDEDDDDDDDDDEDDGEVDSFEVEDLEMADEDDDEMELYDGTKDGRKWKRGECSFEMQDSESSEEESEENQGIERTGEEGGTSTVGMMMSWRPSDDEGSEKVAKRSGKKGKTKKVKGKGPEKEKEKGEKAIGEKDKGEKKDGDKKEKKRTERKK